MGLLSMSGLNLAKDNKYSGLGMLNQALNGQNQTAQAQPAAAAPPPTAPPGSTATVPYTPEMYTIQDRAPTQGFEGEQDAQGYADTLAGMVDSFSDPNNILNQRAAQAGLAQANSRGLLNSSMAVGAAQGQVLDRASDLGKTAYSGWMQGQGAKYQNWIAGEAYNRDYVGAMAALPIKSYYDSMRGLMDAAIADPSLMTPDTMSGFANFFQQMSNDMFSNYQYADGTPLSGASDGGV